jgi:pimeloyl-ACP methyl ester carboxylesterase
MRSAFSAGEGPVESRCLVVFLPGLGDRDWTFEEHGFADALRARGLAADAVAADATFGYYMNGSLLTRLREDVLHPLAARGYKHIWLVGISMGGLGSLLLAKAPDPLLDDRIAGITLLAPYLGNDALLREINAAGGLSAWQPGNVPPGDYERDVWRYLKERAASPNTAPAVFLGAGDTDKLRVGHRILAAALTKERVFRTEGGHDWGPWATLWGDFLDRSDFRDRCAVMGEPRPATK